MTDRSDLNTPEIPSVQPGDLIWIAASNGQHVTGEVQDDMTVKWDD